MTAEEKRELLLKRALPGLAITILYFVFVSGMLAEKMKKAETDYKTLANSGASKDALPAVITQQSQIQQQLIDAQKKTTERQEQFNKMAGFLSTNDGSTNTVMAKLAKILDDNQVKISKDEKRELPEAKLGLALKEVWQGIKPPKVADKKTPKTADNKATDAQISVRHLSLKGSYTNMYQALKTMADPKLQVLPVSLTMHMPEVDPDNSGEMEWELILWM